MNNTSYLEEESEKIKNTKNVLHEKYSRLKVRCSEQQEQIELLQERLQAAHQQVSHSARLKVSVSRFRVNIQGESSFTVPGYSIQVKGQIKVLLERQTSMFFRVPGLGSWYQ